MTVKAKSSTVIRLAIRIGGALVLALGVALLVGCFFTDIPDNPSIQLPTHMYVDAENGSDTSGDGTSAIPFRTITKALNLFYDLAGVDEDTHFPRAGSPLTLHVAEGVYNKNLGEEDTIVLNNVILKGEGTLRDDVKVLAAIGVVAACRIEHVHCYKTIHLVQKDPYQTPPGAKAIIEDVDGGTIGITIMEFGPEVEIINSRLGGIRASLLNSITVRDCQVIDGRGISIAAKGKILIENNTINRCFWGVMAYSEEQEVTLRGNVISECSPGISIGAKMSCILDSNIVTGCYNGIGACEVIVIGENTITGSRNYNIIDRREPYSGLLLIQGITWDDPQPSGRVDGPTPWMPGTNYYIENEGNSIVLLGLTLKEPIKAWLSYPQAATRPASGGAAGGSTVSIHRPETATRRLPSGT